MGNQIHRRGILLRYTQRDGVNDMKRLMILVLAVALMILPMAAMAETVVNNAGELQTALSHGGTIKLGSDIRVDSHIVMGGGNAVLNLNGHTIYNDTNIWNTVTKVWSLISVQGGSLTINGSGSLQAKANDCYAIDVRNGAKLTINGGNYVGNIAAVYVLEGTATINGGSFEISQLSEFNDGRYLLNCLDENFRNGTAKINVTGGTFKNGFDPSENLAEGRGTAFVPENATVTKDGNSYIVKTPVEVVQNVSMPSTGDENSMMLWMCLMVISCAGIIGMGKLRRE